MTPLDAARKKELQALREQIAALEEVNDLQRQALELPDREPELEPTAPPAAAKKRKPTKNPGALKAALLKCLKEHGGETTIGHLTQAARDAGCTARALIFVLRRIAKQTSPNVWALNEGVAS